MPSPAESAQRVVDKVVTELQRELPPILVRYLAEVLEWNSVLSLVSRKDPVGACERLLLESLELGDRLEIDRVARIADVGSGAGFPGLVWALLYPTVEVVLIERREKRALFLERTARALGAGNVTVLAKDLVDVSHETPRGAFSLITSVAVGDPSGIALAVAQMLASGGLFASTVSRETAEPARLLAGFQLVDRLDGKFGCYVIYQRGV